MPRRNTLSETDAVAMLQKDHADVAALFDRFEIAAEGEKEDVADSICTLLTMHATCEEELVYPAAHEALDDDSTVFAAEIEHASARDLIAQIEALALDDPRFDAAMKVLGEYVRHHVEEEETGLFPRLRDTDLDLEALGASITSRKQELLDGGLGGEPVVIDDDEDDDAVEVASRRRAGHAADH